MIAAIGRDAPLHPDFGSGKWDGGPIGIPFDVVSSATPTARVRFEYADESDQVRYPIPKGVHIEGGPRSTGDRHALLRRQEHVPAVRALRPPPHERAAGRPARARRGASGRTSSGPPGWTSADAAGLPIFPGLARWDEVSAGVIDHALRFTAPATRRAYVYPARHYASDSTSASLPPMGLRVRLKASVDISTFPPQARVVLGRCRSTG